MEELHYANLEAMTQLGISRDLHVSDAA